MLWLTILVALFVVWHVANLTKTNPVVKFSDFMEKIDAGKVQARKSPNLLCASLLALQSGGCRTVLSGWQTWYGTCQPEGRPAGRQRQATESG
jgi:uncharacterized membrane protein YphA (DoxX/SURF4 family)